MVNNTERSGLSKIFWGVIALLVIIFICKINVSTLSSEQTQEVLAQKRQNYTKELNKEELENFINLYPKFKKDMISLEADIDYISEYPEKANWAVKRWFMYKFWDIGRFFYVQKRAQEALNFARERQKAADIAAQFVDSEDETSQKLYEMQKTKADDLGDFSLDELQLVSKKAEELKRIFK